ncbi:MAG TPA: hypothetical protein VNQ80_02215 [Parapedobacter sp.]|uniref:hypothetical protein n=1 Tax=Parapedobacter sp. TaxID=1958893 RepID=UPI002CFDC45D|nr:hypothetical protein [Parapedobacter sp.]HWK56122.1 hypothetical protein [Parapedobacter sp.]
MNPMKMYGHLVAVLVLVVLFFSVQSCAKDRAASEDQVVDPLPDSIVNTVLSPIPMDKFIGANGIHEDDLDWMEPIGTLRAYCNWDWFQGDSPENELIFQNSRSGWYFDDVFKRIKSKGISIVMCFQGAPKGLQGGDDFKFSDKPIDAPGLSTTDPHSYRKVSEMLYQIAARYGKAKVDVDALTSDDKLSGLGLIDYIEVGNEPDKDWEGEDAEFSPEEYAAMLSICYDRIKEADPEMKVAMAGLATLSTEYVERMRDWFVENRPDKKFAADAVNVHIYAFNNKIVWGKTWPLFGPSETPEDALFKKKSAELVNFCRTHIPNSEVWISEFGWDTNAESVLSPKPISGISLEETQARWLIRGYLEFAAAGISQAHMFMLVDPSQNYISTQFGTSGLLDRTLAFSKKTSWYYVHQFRDALTGLYFVGEEKSDNPDLRIYKFIDPETKIGCYAVWMATSTNATEKAFVLPLDAGATEATLIQLRSDDKSPSADKLSINNNSVTVDVSEKPIFISVNKID